MSDDELEPTVDVRAGGKARATRAPNPVPWYRRGIVWFVFVLVTATGALWISYAAEDDATMSPAEGAPAVPAVTLP